MSEHDPDLEAFIANARAAVHDPIPAPDFADLMTRIRGAGDAPLQEADGDLAGFVGAARRSAEQDIEDRRLKGIPPVPSRARPRRARRWLPLAVAVAAVAAIGVTTWTTGAATSLVGKSTVDEARFDFRSRDSGGEAHRRGEGPTSRSTAPNRNASSPDADGEPDPEVQTPMEVEPPPESASESADSRETGDAPARVDRSTPRGRSRAVEKPTRAERLRRLASEAELAWRERRLDDAEAGFRAIIELAPRSTDADMAWGDLFTLARQRGAAQSTAELWRQYLAIWPEGRHADDARAGLCRRQGDADTCWTDYLRDFPGGAHVAAARRAVEPDPE